MHETGHHYASARHVFVGVGTERVRVRVLLLPAAEPTTRRVVLLHGNPSHIEHWAPMLPSLRARAEVLAFDHPGLGESDEFADRKHSLERSARTVLAVLDHAGWPSPIDVVGQSHGALVALALDALAPGRVRSLALLSSGGTPAHATYRFFRVPGLAQVLFEIARVVSAAYGRAGSRSLIARALSAAIRAGARGSFWPHPVPDIVVDEGLRASPTIMRSMVRLAGDGPCEKAASYARRGKAPLVFLHARDDALVPIEYVQRLFEEARASGRDASLVTVEGGHMVHYVDPLRVNPLLEAWLGRDHSGNGPAP
jgi:pimeloyl-ACP methyl ester carboxylesterase